LTAQTAPRLQDVALRVVLPSDLPLFFEHQRDPAASRMAAFTARDPGDRRAFDAHWNRIRADPGITLRTVVCGTTVAGYVVAFERSGQPEVGYWIGRSYWGRGIATAALRLFLAVLPARPLFARVAADNAGSIRVLEKCGFTVYGHETSFANARGEHVAETILTNSA
jgi:RimJ/RimL family protein N-acetyltransferase